MRDENESSNYVNMDANALVAAIEKPETAEGQSASAAIGNRHPIVSQQAASEFLNPPEGTGKGSAESLTRFLADKQGVMRPHPTQATINSLVARGLKDSDARVVGAGAEAGVSTLTRDSEVLKRVPELTETF
jgi:hypothetical protein